MCKGRYIFIWGGGGGMGQGFGGDINLFYSQPGEGHSFFGKEKITPCRFYSVYIQAKLPVKINLNSGLLIFRVVAESRNSGKSLKSREIHKNTQNTSKFGRNLIKYMSVQQFWNLSQLLGVFTCRELANLCQNFVTETCKQHSETTRRRLCCENLGTSHDVKGFAIGSFLKRIVVERALTSVRKTLKTLVCWAQNRSISREICPENNPKIRRFFTDCFPAKFATKIPAKFPQNRPIFSRFFPKKSREIWAFFPRPIRSPVNYLQLSKNLYIKKLSSPN